MTTQAESPIVTPPAQFVGNAFMEQYYHILHQSPELVYRFYQDSSVLSRPDSNGVLTSATTMQGINEKILSLNHKDYIAEIKTIDAQQSLGDGVVVLVIGYLIGKDSARKKFAQSFFLAPQEKGYYVLNDVFRFVEDEHKVEALSAPADGSVDNVSAVIQTPEPEQPSHVVDLPEQVHEPANVEDLNNALEICDPSVVEKRSITEEEVVDPSPSHLDQSQNLKAMMTNPSPMLARAPACNVKVKRLSSNQEASGSAKPAPISDAQAPKSESWPEKIDVREEAEGCSVYLRNLPQSATAVQLEEVFTKFGPIKQGGIRVRTNKQGFCFVDFESLSSMKSAIEASPILIGTRQTTVEEKRPTNRGSGLASPNNGRGRYLSSRSGSRSESFRGRGNFSGGRSYGRNDSIGPSEFSGRPRGSAGRGSEGYSRANQNGSINGAPQGGPK